MSGRGGRRGGRRIFYSIKVRSVWRNFNNSNRKHKRQDLKFYPHVARTDWQMEKFTKVKKYIILNIQSEFLNGIDTLESIRKGSILYFSKEIPIKKTSK